MSRPPLYDDNAFGLRNANRFHRQPIPFLMELAASHEDLVEFRLGPLRACLLLSPHILKDFFVDQRDDFTKLKRHAHALRKLEGDSLFLSEGQEWLKRRRLVGTAFQPARMDQYGRAIVELTEQRLRGWSDGQSLNAADELTELALAALGKTMFNAELDVSVLRKLAAVRSECLIREMSATVPIPDWVPLPGKIRKRRMIRQWKTCVDQLIRDRRASGQDLGDFLSIMLNSVDQEGDRTGLTDQQARDDATLLFTAGFDNVATALVWTLYLILSHKDVEAKVLGELLSVVGDRSLRADDVRQLAYLEMVINESMRLFPPGWCLSFRQAKRTARLGNYAIAKGTWIIVSPYVQHRNPANFDHPDVFDPERFSPERRDQIKKYTFLPFSAGPRTCLGSGLAMMELSLILGTILSRFRLRISPNLTVEPVPLLTLRPKGGVQMSVEAKNLSPEALKNT